ncbi:MAG: glycosyltransferase family 2 protein [Planctomycetes bacterium]|nr:glycosyltransferase family 2 protein [Planctomycetota bacterium]
MAVITACTYTLNNAAVLEDCLKSLRWADEVMVLDSGSTDATVEIGKRFADRVEHRAWTGFRDQLEHVGRIAKGDWVLVVDADERVTEALAREVRQAVGSGTPHDAFEIPRRTRYLGRWLAHGEFVPDYTGRLYRRGKERYVGEPHARLVVDGTTGRLREPILHLGYPDLSAQVNTTTRYSRAAAREALDVGRSATLPGALGHGVSRWGKGYIAKRGFLDGVPGWVNAVTSGWAAFVKHAWVWESRRRR